MAIYKNNNGTLENVTGSNVIDPSGGGVLIQSKVGTAPNERGNVKIETPMCTVQIDNSTTGGGISIESDNEIDISSGSSCTWFVDSGLDLSSGSTMFIDSGDWLYAKAYSGMELRCDTDNFSIISGVDNNQCDLNITSTGDTKIESGNTISISSAQELDIKSDHQTLSLFGEGGINIDANEEINIRSSSYNIKINANDGNTKGDIKLYGNSLTFNNNDISGKPLYLHEIRFRFKKPEEALSSVGSTWRFNANNSDYFIGYQKTTILTQSSPYYDFYVSPLSFTSSRFSGSYYSDPDPDYDGYYMSFYVLSPISSRFDGTSSFVSNYNNNKVIPFKSTVVGDTSSGESDTVRFTDVKVRSNKIYLFYDETWIDTVNRSISNHEYIIYLGDNSSIDDGQGYITDWFDNVNKWN